MKHGFLPLSKLYGMNFVLFIIYSRVSNNHTACMYGEKSKSKWVIPFTSWAFKIIKKSWIVQVLVEQHQIVLLCKLYEIEFSICGDTFGLCRNYTNNFQLRKLENLYFSRCQPSFEKSCWRALTSVPLSWIVSSYHSLLLSFQKWGLASQKQKSLA